MSAQEAQDPLVLRCVRPQDVAGLEGSLRRLLSLQGFDGAAGQRAVITAQDVEIFLGLGPHPTRQALRSAIDGLGLPGGAVVRTETSPAGTLPGLAGFAILAELAAAGFVVDGVDPGRADGVGARAEAEALRRAREWTNAPGASLYPEAFADMAEELALSVGLRVDVWDAERLEAERCGAILAVGQGSQYTPRLVDVRYEPPGATRALTLVGKGVTFDTGGLSLKSPAAMAPMRMDKVGAATVLAVMSVLPRLGLPVRVRGLLPLAENMIGPGAVRPGDVVVGRSGTPITVMDTDFEGRVLMSDALTLACEEPTDGIIDIAALTYQVAIALGHGIGGLFANDDAFASEILSASGRGGEDLWRLPLADRYESQVALGDGVKNHPESDVGRAITAALFLRHFIVPGTPWAHLDITGPAWVGPASGPGATGFGVRTLLEFLRGWSAGR